MTNKILDSTNTKKVTKNIQTNKVVLSIDIASNLPYQWGKKFDEVLLDTKF